MNSSPDYLAKLAQFAATTRLEEIPLEVIARAKEILLDTLPVIAAGMRSPELQALADRQIASGASDACSVIGTGRTTHSLDAGMLNGIAGAWLDFDEGNTRANGHPGIQVLPAALAVAQARGLSGRAFLSAFIIGYEIVARIGAATQLKLIVNPHGTFGVVGAALAVARLSGLAVDQYRELASIAASACMATNRHTMLNGATVRNWYAGHSATMGQMAVRLVQSGFTGPADGLSTTFGLVLGDDFAPEVAIAGLGERWMLTDSYIKLYPTARYVHSAIDALQAALADAAVKAIPIELIDRIDVRAYRLAAFLKNQLVNNWFGARFSIPFALATLLVGTRPGLAAFGDEAVADSQVQALAARVHVIEDEAYTAAYPEQQSVSLTIQLRDGLRYAGRSDITSGERTRPHRPEAIYAKFQGLAEAAWGPSNAARMRAVVMQLEDVPDMAQWMEFSL